MCRIDGHSTGVADRHYVCNKPAADAKIARAIFEDVAGKPVAWPSPAELDSGMVRSDERLRTRFFRTVAGGAIVDSGNENDDGDEGGEGEECGEEEEPVGDEEVSADESDAEADSTAVVGDPVAIKEVGPSAQQPGDGSSSGSTDRRRIVYNAGRGKFDKFDPAPNLIQHKPFVAKVQTKLNQFSGTKNSSPSVDASGPKRTRLMLSNGDKAYLESKAPAASWGVMCPDKASLESIVEAGKATGQLNPDAGYEGARSHLRAAQKQQHEEFVKRQAKEEKKRAKTAAQAKKAELYTDID